jgi:hypothetical protein
MCSFVQIAFAERAWFVATEARNARSVCFFLKCQAKDRGYVDKHIVQHEPTATAVLTEDIVDAHPAAQNDPPAPRTGAVPPQ